MWRTHKNKVCNLVSNEYYCLGGESSIVYGRKVQVANRVGGESSRGRNVQGAKRQSGETSINLISKQLTDTISGQAMPRPAGEFTVRRSHRPLSQVRGGEWKGRGE